METIDKAIEYIRDFFKEDYSGHDFAHSLRVYEMATKIARKEHADLFVVQLSALLHDVDDHKLTTTYESKENAKRFMEENKIEKNIQSQVLDIIDEISFMASDSVVPSTLEGKCVQDADRLDAIGAIGIARTFAYGGSKHHKMVDPTISPNLSMNKEEYFHQDNSTTINHFYEKLLLLKDMMNTDTAKEIAKHRHQYMLEFLDEFMDECHQLK